MTQAVSPVQRDPAAIVRSAGAGAILTRVSLSLAAFGGLLSVGFWLPYNGSIEPRGYWPLWFVSLLLGLGLLTGSRRARTDGWSPGQWAGSLASLAALLTILWAETMDGGMTFDLPGAALRVALGFLCFVLVAGPLVRNSSARRLLELAGMVAALLTLMVTLLNGTAWLVMPQWPLSFAAIFLGIGLLAGPLRGRSGAGVREVMLAERVRELARTRRGALDVQATEMRRIERDLHDGAQVRLVALSMKLGRAEHKYRDDPEIAAFLRETREDTAEAIRELRELARGIAPPVLADRGLEPAVRSLAERSGADVAVTSSLERRPPTAVETAAYFVVAESLTNAGKHAPGARVEITLLERSGQLLVEITDFGPGGANPAGTGLTGLRQRVEAVDGVLRITSPHGVGTQIEASIPCER